MTRFMCRFCGHVFEKEEISISMESNTGKFKGWAWSWTSIRDNCPVCRKGMDDWYVSEIMWKYDWLGAVRYQRNVEVGE